MRSSVLDESPAHCGFRSTLDRIRDIDELVTKIEPLRDELAQAAYAERLGRVVACRDEGHAGLAGERHHGLGRLAGEERIEPGVDRLLQVACGAAGDDAERTHPFGAAVEHERLAPGQRVHALEELRRRKAVAREARGTADRAAAVHAEGLARLSSEALGD